MTKKNMSTNIITNIPVIAMWRGDVQALLAILPSHRLQG